MTGRQALFDDVYLAVPVSGARGWALRYRDIITLCRRLGLGLLAVKGAAVEALYQKSLAEQDEAKRKAIFNQMEDLMESSGGDHALSGKPRLRGVGIRTKSVKSFGYSRCSLEDSKAQEASSGHKHSLTVRTDRAVSCRHDNASKRENHGENIFRI